MKIKVKGYLKDITNNKIDSFSISAIKNKNKISYILNNDKYTLKIVSPKKLILLRENKDMNSILYFESNKCLSSLYTIKENNITLEIDIKTLKIVMNDNIINIIYLVKDSDNKYEYYIEMSD